MAANTVWRLSSGSRRESTTGDPYFVAVQSRYVSEGRGGGPAEPQATSQ